MLELTLDTCSTPNTFDSDVKQVMHDLQQLKQPLQVMLQRCCSHACATLHRLNRFALLLCSDIVKIMKGQTPVVTIRDRRSIKLQVAGINLGQKQGLGMGAMQANTVGKAGNTAAR